MERTLIEAFDQQVLEEQHGVTPPPYQFWLASSALGAVWLGTVGSAAGLGRATRAGWFTRFNAGALLTWWYFDCWRMIREGTWAGVLHRSSWRKFEVGGPKVPWLPGLSPRRSYLDVAAHIASALLLVVVLFHRRAPRWSARALGACLLLLCVSDPLHVGDYLATTLVLMLLWCCLPTSKGSLAGMQATMILLMVGAGISKLGPHFSRPGVLCCAPVIGYYAPSISALFWRGPGDVRPSDLATLISVVFLACELGVPLLLLSPSRAVVRGAVALLVLMHVAMALCTRILAFMEMYFVVLWCYLFLGGDKQGPAYGFHYAGLRAMPRLVKAGALAFAIVNLWAQLQPDLDWHPLFKYNHFASGNQPCQNPVLVRRAAVPKMMARIPSRDMGWQHRPGLGHVQMYMGVRWIVELNHRSSAAVLDYAMRLCGADARTHTVVMAEEFTATLAGHDSSSMNSYNRLFFEEVARMGFLDECDAVLVWLAPVSWPLLPLGRQTSVWSIWDGSRGLWKAGELTPRELQSVSRPSDAVRLLPEECRENSSEPGG